MLTGERVPHISASYSFATAGINVAAMAGAWKILSPLRTGTPWDKGAPRDPFLSPVVFSRESVPRKYTAAARAMSAVRERSATIEPGRYRRLVARVVPRLFIDV
jgi:hypothetical protein